MAIYFEGWVWLVGMGILVIPLVFLWKRKASFSYLFCFFLFWIYILFVIKETLFPIIIDPQMAEVMKGQFMSQVNLIPFYFGPYARFDRVFPGIILNIILTVPFGFGVRFIAHVKPRNIIWLSVAVGLGIEAGQFLISLALGYPYRVMDINDLCNAAGILVGYSLFRLFAWLYLAGTERFKITPKGLFKYILEVASLASV